VVLLTAAVAAFLAFVPMLANLPTIPPFFILVTTTGTVIVTAAAAAARLLFVTTVVAVLALVALDTSLSRATGSPLATVTIVVAVLGIVRLPRVGAAMAAIVGACACRLAAREPVVLGKGFSVVFASDAAVGCAT